MHASSSNIIPRSGSGGADGWRPGNNQSKCEEKRPILVTAPIGFFYAKAKDGGLEVQRLRYTIPVMRISRLQKMYASKDLIMQAIVKKATVRQPLEEV